MTEKSATLPIVLTLLLAYGLIDIKSKVEDVANATQELQQQSSAHWPRGSLDNKEFLVNSALGSLGLAWDASEGMAPHQVDWSLGPVQTVNAVLNYVALNLYGSGELAASLAGYSIAALFAFPLIWPTRRPDALGVATTLTARKSEQSSQLALPQVSGGVKCRSTPERCWTICRDTAHRPGSTTATPCWAPAHRRR